MLGRAARDAQDVIKVLGKKTNQACLSADFKYDGERTQMHYHQTASGTPLKLFSRNFELQNSKFWHIEELLRRQLAKSKHSFIVDGEVVYVDPEGKFLPF